MIHAGRQEAGWQDEVLAFWFGELAPQDWFSVSPDTDAAIGQRFTGLHHALAAGLDAEAVDDARTALAAIIVLDQFPRNIHRGSMQAFATDDLALRIARRAVDRRLDDALEPQEKQFLYMPFMHSEVVADQERGVDLFRTLGNEDALKYAIEHRDIIARFGRFPHRNRALGRQSTPEEMAFLETHPGYGQ